MLHRFRQPNVWIAVLSIVVIVLGVWRYSDDMMVLAKDEAALQVFVTGLGWWGPLALVGLNVLQTVVAPIPGHAIYVAAGFLFGAVKGSFWGIVGMLCGAGTAMFISRRFGRPLVVYMVGEARLTRWEQVTHSGDLLVWALVLLSPIGDTPFLLAGLSSKTRYHTILLLAFVTRGPQVFVAAAIGAGVLVLTMGQVVGLFVLLAVPLVVGLRYQAQLTDWFYRRVSRRVGGREEEGVSVTEFDTD